MYLLYSNAFDMIIVIRVLHRVNLLNGIHIHCRLCGGAQVSISGEAGEVVGTRTSEPFESRLSGRTLKMCASGAQTYLFDHLSLRSS